MPKTVLPIDWRPIDHVVLDFGGVLYDIDHQRTASAFEALGFKNFQSLYDHGHQSALLDDLECGSLAEEDFLMTLRNRCAHGASVDDVRDAWNAVLIGLKSDVMPSLQRLGRRFDLLLFSNTNAIHAAHFEQQILNTQGRSFGDAFRQVIYSHRLGQRKPHVGAYETVAAQHGLDPEATLFIDDTLVNVHGARAAGWQAIHYEPKLRSFSQLLDDLGFETRS